MEIEPGDRKRQVINIGNVHTEKTISLTLGLADWSLDEDGKILLAPPGDLENSAAEWARFSPAFVTLKPGESTQIVVDMSTPSRLEASGDHRFALLASTILPQRNGGQSGVWKKYQIATLFYLTADPAESQPVITGSGLVLEEDAAPKLELIIENGGNAHARLEGEIAVKAPGLSETVPVSNLVVLDEARRRFVAELPPETPADADIEVRLQNIHAPQYDDDLQTLPTHEVPVETKRASLNAAE